MAQYDVNIRDYWRVIKKRKFIVIFTLVSMGIFSLFFSFLWQPVPLYEATASIKVERTGSVTGLYMQRVSWAQTDYMETQSSIIKSYYVMEKVAKRLGLIPSDIPSEKVRSNNQYQGIILNLRNNVTIEQEGYSNILNVSVTSGEPAFAQRIANTISGVYKEQHVLDINKRTIEAKNFIEGQLKVVQGKLRDSEERTKIFREDNSLISLNAQTSTLLAQLSSLQVAYEKAHESRQKLETTIKLLIEAKNKPLTSETSFYINEASTLYKSLNDRLVKLMLERDTLLLIYTEKYPQVVEMNKQIRETVESMKAQLLSHGKILGEEIETLQTKIGQLDEEIRMLPEKGLKLARLEQDVQVNREIYLLLEKKYQESLIKEAEKIEEVQIVKPALEPRNPINPPKIMQTGVVGILIGLILGIVFAFVVETFDTSIGAIEEVEELTGVHVLGIIPHVSIHEMKSALLGDKQGAVDDKTVERYSRIASHFAPKSTLAESYKALRTNLSFSSLTDDIKVMLFTSSSPREGKTSTVVNLAVTMAQAGKQVLLIDGDLRKPIISNIFGISQAPGLSEVILGNYTWKEVIRTVTDMVMGKMSIDDIIKTPGMDNLHILTSGAIPPNPADLISSDRINEIIKEAGAEYDMVLIDTPPLLSATDAAVLGSRIDGIVLVYRAGKVGRGVLIRAKAQLDNVKAKLIGVVLNGLKAEVSPDFTSQDYYEYYHYYGGEDKKRWLERLRDRLLTIPAFISGQTKKDTGKKPDIKSFPTKPVVFLITLLLLVTAALYQLGYLKQPLTLKDLPPGRHIDSLSENADKGRIVKRKIAYVRNSSKREQGKIESADRMENVSNEGYTVHVASFRDLDNANKLVNTLKMEGIDAQWFKYDINDNGVWYRVLVGQFANEDEASGFMKDKGLDRIYPGARALELSSSF
ncbi:MAG: polysaccharide biosynthesis tyrosine autokinase [Thermodesulfobacteriota bacterium]|nr:polysaccharide biosynthesis tyrosine autokinase [Thermodesulfobacteriota bacterium]